MDGIGPADHVIHVLLIWLASVCNANGRRTKIWLPKSLQAEIWGPEGCLLVHVGFPERKLTQ